MKNGLRLLLSSMVLVIVCSSTVWSHCQIPCGIYDDQMRAELIAEHITTIEKSMNQIMDLEKEEDANSNQLVRWIMNKEEHASEIQEIVTSYFMTQRIALGADNYEKKLTALHKLIIYAMKCKQATDLSHIKNLRSALDDFNSLYFK